MTTYIVSRHKGAIEWLKNKGFSGVVVDHISADMVKAGDMVIGVLPLLLVHELVNMGVNVIILQLPEVPREQRGKELTVEDMNRYNAKVFKVNSLILERC